MDIPQSTIQKMKMLSDDKLSIVVDLVNQLSLEDPKDIFTALCENGAQNPMTEEEIDDFVSDVRKSKESDLNSFFGSVKSFPDGLSFQREARNGWDCN